MSHAELKTAPDFGYALRAVREELGLTQTEVAERADVSVRWLSNFERGKSPRAELMKVVHVARALDYAFALAKAPQAPTEVADSLSAHPLDTLTRMNQMASASIAKAVDDGVGGLSAMMASLNRVAEAARKQQVESLLPSHLRGASVNPLPSPPDSATDPVEEGGDGEE